MANRRFEMFEYRHVIHRMRMGQSDRAIAKSRVMGRVKCGLLREIALDHGWLEEGPLPEDGQIAAIVETVKKSNPTRTSLSLDHQGRIKEWIGQGIWLTTIYRTLVDQFGFTGSYSSVQRLAKKIRAASPEATCILDFAPGEAAQVDFGKGPTIIDAFTGEELKTWFFVMTLCFSRHMYAEIVTDQKVSTWLGCHRRALEWFGGVAGKIIVDNCKCAIVRACFRDPEVQRAYGDQAEGYGFIISPCPPRDPQKKGRVEAGVKYVKKAFMPLRRFRTLADANAQLRTWIMETAGNRVHGTTRQKPLSLFAETEKPMLRPLPDVPVEIATWAKLKVHGDCHVRFEKCLYSAPFRLVRQQVWVKASDTCVKIYQDLKLVAAHPRLRKPGSRATIDDHLPPEAIAYKMQDPQWCLRQSELIGSHCHQFIRRLFAHRVLDNLRAAQGVIGLKKKYGALRLEAACRRALHFDNIKYQAVKNILVKGLDQQPLHEASNVIELAATYISTGRFMRSGQEMQLPMERRRP